MLFNCCWLLGNFLLETTAGRCPPEVLLPLIGLVVATLSGREGVCKPPSAGVNSPPVVKTSSPYQLLSSSDKNCFDFADDVARLTLVVLLLLLFWWSIPWSSWLGVVGWWGSGTAPTNTCPYRITHATELGYLCIGDKFNFWGLALQLCIF